MILNVLIVDDVVASRETLSNYLTKYCEKIRITGMADSVKTALAEYKKGKGGQVIMSDDAELEVSVNKKDQFLEIFKEI